MPKRKPKRKNPNQPNILNKEKDSRGNLVLGVTGYNLTIRVLGVKVFITPLDFLRLSAPKYEWETLSFIKDKIINNYPIASPYLIVKIPAREWNDGLNVPAKIRGHEGRTRMKAILSIYGNIPIETHLILKSDMLLEGIEIFKENELSYKTYIELLNHQIITETGDLYEGPWFET